MQAADRRRFVLPALFLLIACDSSNQENASEPAPPSDTQLRDEPDWTRFPIVIDGVSTAHLETEYTIEIDEEMIELSDFADVVTQWIHFQPCDEYATDLINARESFSYGYAEDYLTFADTAGLHVIWPLPYWGSTALEPCGLVVEGGDGDGDPPDTLWTDNEEIQIPLHPQTGKNLLTTDFTAYWTAKAEIFIDELDALDTNNLVWGYRVIEEFTPNPGELEFALAQRDTINTVDGTRYMFAYSPNHSVPDGDTLYTLIEIGGLGSTTSQSYTLNPADPVARSANNGVVDDFYPKVVSVERLVNKNIVQMFDHVVTGAYTEYAFAPYAPTVVNENRIHPYHRARLGREALDNLAQVYEDNNTEESISQEPPDHILFHAPDMTPDALTMTTDHARHDLWAGLHEAGGLFIYSFAYRASNASVWEEYVRALYLIKQDMRPYLANGPTLRPTISDNENVLSDVYVTAHTAIEDLDAYALPDSPDQHQAINATLFVIDDFGYLIVTNSVELEDPLEVDIDLVNCIDDVEIVSGSSANMTFSTHFVTDVFEGIDGRVYEVTLDDLVCI